MDEDSVWVGASEGLSNMTANHVDALNAQFSSATTQDILRYCVDTWGDRITLASSLGAEDQVLTHMMQSVGLTDVFVLDTGRLHQETYDVMAKTMDRYPVLYRVFFPDSVAVQAMVSEHGPNHFYQSVDHRLNCCHIRKVEPLSRALTGYSAWMTGIRRAQSVDRMTTPFFEWDHHHGIMKINPLIHWTKDDVWQWISDHDVPYNALHDQGYQSIGCQPCTRPVEPGQVSRAGRWWWEASEKKECGLHVSTRIRKD